MLTKAMASENVTIARRPGWAFMGDITVSIECDPLASVPVKMGLAVRAAFRSRADLYGANLYGANLSGANLSGANLSGANLSRANLSRANLSGADLSGANLSRANLYGADLYGANLSRANLSGADLYGANLSGADLYGADLSGADLSRANLSGANLSGANLSRANLSRANLSGADLSGADLYGEKIVRMITSTGRSDGYVFYAFEMQAGGVKIKAGCRWFTPVEFRAHVASEYPGTDKASETGRILDLIEGRMVDLGITAKKARKPRKVVA